MGYGWAMTTFESTQSPLADAVMYLERGYVDLIAFTGGNANARDAVSSAYIAANPQYSVISGVSSRAESDVINALGELKTVVVPDLEDLRTLVTITGLGGVVINVSTVEEDQGTSEEDGFQYWSRHDLYIDFDAAGAHGAIAQIEQHLQSRH